MRTLSAFFVARFKTVMTYRFAAISGIITQIVFAFFKIFTIYTFISGNVAKAPLKADITITYIWLTQIFLSLTPLSVNRQDLNSIRKGNIAYELARPVSLFSLLYSRTLAWRSANSIVRVIPIVLFNMLVLPILGFKMYSISIASVNTLVLFLISIIIAYFLSTMITVFLYSITLYTIDASNFIGIFNSFAIVLSGTIIPLSYFPNSMQKMLVLQPFKGIIDTPALILTGQYTFQENIFYILLQVIWLLILFLLNMYMFNKGTKKIVVQGG